VDLVKRFEARPSEKEVDMNRRPALSLVTVFLTGVSLALALPPSAFAQDEQSKVQVQSAPPSQPNTDPQARNDGQTTSDAQSAANSRIARLSFTQGDVQVQRPDSDWQSAEINLPLQQGFRVATTEGRAEIQLESGVILRLAENSILEFTELDSQNSGRITKLNLTQGTIIVTADLRPVDSFSVDAPSVHVTVRQPSRFRVDTTQGDSWVGIFAGDVMVKTAAGETKVANGHTFHISGAAQTEEANQVSIDMNPPADDFDQWAADRDQSIQQGYHDAVQYVANYAPDYAEYSYGLSDLSSYGHWAVSPGCGLCWEPYGVPDHWRPFFFGSWEFFGGRGWTWISSEPWGWLPFHTGHWFPRAGGGWMWQPGPFRAWNPAPVQWFNVGNQLAWAPAGALNSHGQPSPSGIVIGTREPRGVKITPGLRPPLTSELTEKITRATAPVVQRGEFHEASAQSLVQGTVPSTVVSARPPNFPADSTIRFDPATRTFMNAYPDRKPTPPDSVAENSEAAASSSGGGSASPRRAIPAGQSNSGQRPSYYTPPPHAAPVQGQQTHSSTPPPATSHGSTPPPVHSAPPAHSSGNTGTSSGHH
jgi:hypothetical protein